MQETASLGFIEIIKKKRKRKKERVSLKASLAGQFFFKIRWPPSGHVDLGLILPVSIISLLDIGSSQTR